VIFECSSRVYPDDKVRYHRRTAFLSNIWAVSSVGRASDF
jgi:hypothetical protein